MNITTTIKATVSKYKKTSFVVLACLIGGYIYYRSTTSSNTVPSYTVAVAHLGILTQTVSGTGQVSSSNQTDIQSQVSGTIDSIDVSVGQTVTAGQLIATIDSKNAAISLENAKINLAKLTEPAKVTDLSNAEAALNKSYSDAFNSASTIYLDLPNIMSGMKNILYGQTGFISDQRSSFLIQNARALRDNAGREYDAAVAQYQSSLAEFNALNRTSATSSIDNMLSDTYITIKDVAKAVADVQNTITYITTTQPDFNSSGATSAATSVNTWASLANNDLSALVSAQNSIQSNRNSISTLVAGADQYDIQSAQLSVQQAQQTYNNYFIRAPYDGIIGRIPVNVYGQASNGTTIATVIGAEKIASISLNEVDAAKVAVGQPVAITFDAIDGLNATGTVSVVDQIGTVSSGVVSYGVKIHINTEDDRIKPGMSVNTSIVTKEDNNVLIVPSSAVKTQSGKNYVQVIDRSVITAQRALASSTRALASSTQTLASSTRIRTGATNTFTVSTAIAPVQTFVTIGDTNDTDTIIVSGLTRGDVVVTKTLAATPQTSQAPSILSSLGARGPTGTATRVTGTATSRPGN